VEGGDLKRKIKGKATMAAAKIHLHKARKESSLGSTCGACNTTLLIQTLNFLKKKRDCLVISLLICPSSLT
jgi:hypothetical protein